MRYILHFAIVLSFLYSGPLMARNPVLLPLPQGNRSFFRRETPFHPNGILGGAAGKRPTGQPIQDRGFLG